MMMWMLGLAAMACERPAYGKKVPDPKTDAPVAKDGKVREAVFAGGCFWCTEAVFQQVDGVEQVESGYAGGTAETATYEQVSTGRTGHAEVIRIVYDPSKLTFGRLLQIFFATHDPTTLDAQGPDRGPQYRSAIFYADDEQKQIAEAYIRQLEEEKTFTRPIVTTLEPLEAFYPAEGYHQDYANRNPAQPYIRAWAQPKVEKLRSAFPQQVKQPTTRPGE